MHAGHELIEHRQIEARILLGSDGDALALRDALRQLGQVDEVAGLRAGEDRQHLVGAELAELERRSVPRRHNPERAVVDADVDLAFIVRIGEAQPDERLPLPVPADIQTDAAAACSTAAASRWTAAACSGPPK